MRISILFTLSLCLVLFVACANEAPTTSPAVANGPGSAEDPGTVIPYWVLVGFYTNDQCESGTEITTLTFDTSQACTTATRKTAIDGAYTNSAANFQCYTDRLCLTQHPGVSECNADQPINKEYRTDVCVQEPNGQQLWSKILGGTSTCPEPPPGFQCPVTP